MSTFLWISVSLSFLALFVAMLAERSAIIARINGANGFIILSVLVISFLASLIVALVALVFEGWGLCWRVLVGSLLYHGAMGAALIGYLQWLATRTAAQFEAHEAALRLAFRMSGRKPRA